METMTSPIHGSVSLNDLETPLMRQTNIRASSRSLPARVAVKVFNQPPSPPPVNEMLLSAYRRQSDEQNSPQAASHSHQSRPPQEIYEDVSEPGVDFNIAQNDIYSMDMGNTGTHKASGRGQHPLHPLPMDSEFGMGAEGTESPYYNESALKGWTEEDKSTGYNRGAAARPRQPAVLPTTPLLPPKSSTHAGNRNDSYYYNDSAIKSHQRTQDKGKATYGKERLGKPKKGPDYDTLAEKDKDGPEPTYYNHVGDTEPPYYNHPPTNGSRSTTTMPWPVEDDEPDYDEVDDEDTSSSKRASGHSFDQPASRQNRHAPPQARAGASGFAHNLVGLSAGTYDSECYEDMAGLDEFVESLK